MSRKHKNCSDCGKRKCHGECRNGAAAIDESSAGVRVRSQSRSPSPEVQELLVKQLLHEPCVPLSSRAATKLEDCLTTKVSAHEYHPERVGKWSVLYSDNGMEHSSYRHGLGFIQPSCASDLHIFLNLRSLIPYLDALEKEMSSILFYTNPPNGGDNIICSLLDLVYLVDLKDEMGEKMPEEPKDELINRWAQHLQGYVRGHLYDSLIGKLSNLTPRFPLLWHHEPLLWLPHKTPILMRSTYGDLQPILEKAAYVTEKLPTTPSRMVRIRQLFGSSEIFKGASAPLQHLAAIAKFDYAGVPYDRPLFGEFDALAAASLQTAVSIRPESLHLPDPHRRPTAFDFWHHHAEHAADAADADAACSGAGVRARARARSGARRGGNIRSLRQSNRLKKKRSGAGAGGGRTKKRICNSRKSRK